MNCKTVHNKLIFFLEKELSDSELNLVQEHLESCSECALFAEEMKLTLSILESDKVLEENPYFYTRVKARLENQEQEVWSGRPVLVRILQPIAFSIILLLGVYGGIKLGQPNKTELTGSILSEQQMIPFLNEMDAEPIEAFLMN
jgi:predicted anti-sigma-YlaC factor YlaD